MNCADIVFWDISGKIQYFVGDYNSNLLILILAWYLKEN